MSRPNDHRQEWQSSGLPNKIKALKSPRYQTQMGTMKNVLKVINRTTFVYRTKQERIAGVHALMEVCSISLDLIPNSFSHHRDLLLSLVNRVLTRPELALFADHTDVDTARACQKRYLHLLEKIWARALVHLDKSSQSKGQDQLYSTLLGALYVRLPSARRLIVEAISSPMLSNRAMATFWKKPLLKHLNSILLRHRTGSLADEKAYEMLQHPLCWAHHSHEFDIDLRVPLESVPRLISKRLSEVNNFFGFVEALLAHIDAVFPNSVHYDLIDGFDIVVRATVHRFTSLEWDQLMELSGTGIYGFAKSSIMLSLCAKGILHRTNSFARIEVGICLNVIDSMLLATDTSPTSPTPLKEAFSAHEDLYKALEVLLSSEDFLILIKVLCFLYMHLDRLYGARRQQVVQSLLLGPSYFYRLFLHWHEVVREVFAHILCFRISRVGLGSSSLDLSVKLSSWSALFPFFYRSGFRPQHDRTRRPEQTLTLTPMAHVSLFKDRAVLTRQYKLDSDDEVLDKVLEGNCMLRVELLQAQLEMPQGQCDVPLNMRAYAAPALSEFAKLRQHSISLQKTRPLNPYEVVAPEVSFEIPSAIQNGYI